MKKVLMILALALVLGACTDKQLMSTMETVNQTLGGGSSSPAALTNTEVIMGLKKALDVGINNATTSTSKVNGFLNNSAIKIPFPPEAIKVKNKLSELGMDSQIDKFVMTLNRSAEEATKEAAPIFLNAIKGMSVQDGFAILKGNDDAATKFLRDKTYAELQSKFSPKVQSAIEKVNLTSTWQPLASAYNTATILTGGNQVNPDLDQYVTEKAIDGLFLMLAGEEKKIRENPAARVTDILKKVFSTLDN